MYCPPMTGGENSTGLVQGIRSHVDLDYSRELVALLPEKADENLWSPYGWCEKPKVDIPVGYWCLMVISPHLHTEYLVIQLHPISRWWSRGRRRQPWFRQDCSGA
jgi:hypothetical protein